MLPDSLDSDRAVSPVIGVILMVAITVTLAAVVGAFVMGIGGELMQPAPQVTMEAGDADINLTYSRSTDYVDRPQDNGQDILYIEHRGGDELAYNELRIVIEKRDGDLKYVERNFSKRGIYVASVGVPTNNIVWKQGPFPSNESFTVGERIILTEEEGDSGSDVDIPEGDYKITVIHRPTQSVVDSAIINIK